MSVMSILTDVKDKLFQGINFVTERVRSSLALLMYIRKMVRNDTKNKREEMPSNDTPPPLPPSENTPLIVERRKSPRKKAAKSDDSPSDSDELESYKDRNNLTKEEPVIEAVNKAEGRKSFQIQKKYVMLICGIISFVILSALIFWIFHHPSTAPAPVSKAERHKKGHDSQEAPPSSEPDFQPALDLDHVKGFMATINPHFLMDTPPSPVPGAPLHRVAIVLFDVGISQDESDRALSDLPEEITVAVSPYTPDIEELIDDLKQMGHAVLLQMPWEDGDIYTDLGKYTLRPEQNKENLVENLNLLTRMAEKADGFYAIGGARLVRSPSELTTVLQFIANNKNSLVAPPDVLMTQLHKVSAQVGINYVATTLINPDIKDIALIESLAKRTGFAILAFKINHNVANQIMNWINKLESAKLDVVPMTQIIKMKEAPPSLKKESEKKDKAQ